MQISAIEKSPNWTVSSSGLTATKLNNSVYDGLRASDGFSSGKWYWEGKHISDGGTSSGFGVVLSSVDMKITYGNNIVTAGTNHKYYFRSGVIYNPGTSGNGAIVNGDIIGIALDLDDPSGVVQWYKNGIKQPQSFTGLKSLGATWYPAFMAFNDSSIEFRFTKKAYSYPIPEGYRQAERLNKFLISSEDEIYSIVSEYKGTETTIPKMTSDTAPSGKAFAKSVYNASYAPWKAFNGIDDAEGYASLSGSGGTGYLGYEFPNAISLYKYVVRSTGSSSLTKMPKDWTFEGSNDGVNWNVLDTQTNQTWTTQYTDKIYLLDEPFHYMQFKMYRLNWTANNGFLSYTDVNEMKMFEIIAPKLVKLPATSESSFVEYGMNKGESIDLASDISSINTINTSSSTLGSGKVFKQKINTSKTPIKKASIT
ncbi:SPRY domain-containing protein [Paenibacillus amylolyticus]|uniref:SPRY domain-containing protein n=1 Tax=Paenibacillus amylolyticus TaxID=1451 RepID=UPI00344C55C2